MAGLASSRLLLDVYLPECGRGPQDIVRRYGTDVHGGAWAASVCGVKRGEITPPGSAQDVLTTARLSPARSKRYSRGEH